MTKYVFFLFFLYFDMLVMSLLTVESEGVVLAAKVGDNNVA